MTTSYVAARITALFPSLEPHLIGRALALHTFVSLKHRYLYCAVPKAGCTAIKTLIHAIERLPPIDVWRSSSREYRREMFIHDRTQFRLPSLVDLPSETQEQVLGDPDFFRFTVVRNPFRRLESAWKDKVFHCAPGYENFVLRIKNTLPRGDDPASYVSYAEFVEAIAHQNLATCDFHWRLQTANLFYPALNIDHVGRIEKFGVTVEAFLTRVGRLELMLKTKMNTSIGSAGYTPELAKRVYDLYQSDFETFEYSGDSWQSHGAPTPDGYVPESKYNSEILERNLVIGLLYKRLFEVESSR